MSKRVKPNLFQDPKNVEVKNSDRKIAENLVSNDSGKLIVRYVRSESSCRWTRDEKDRPRFIADIGVPTGCLVAFRTNGRVRIGWSSKNADETLPSTKKGALYTATLRALVDEVIEISSKTHQAGNNTYLPKSISREIPSFMKRVEKYFNERPVNFVDIVEATIAASS